LIIDDYRILEISIFGERKNQDEAFTLLEEYLHKLTQGVTADSNCGTMQVLQNG
jgi:hypothetical protein